VTIWPMCIAWWIPKATNTNSEYVILIVFPMHQWLRERVSMSRCTYFSVLFLSSRGNSALEAVGVASSTGLQDSQRAAATVRTVSWANKPESFVTLMCLYISTGS
jgi:hypothetical protein